MINVLWTGGWDSTFRVLDATLNHRIQVKPYYIIDRDRGGHVMELAAIDAIRGKARARGADILPLETVERSAIPASSSITEALLAMRGEDNVGLQYEWLARFAKSLGQPLELTIHKDDKAHALLQGTDVAANPVFRYFTFPILDMTKVQMRSVAQASGFLDLMDLTWFCHRPIHGRSCGVCGPCCYTRDEGLGYRISLEGRLRDTFRSIKRKILRS
jgi:hypothetical protein